MLAFDKLYENKVLLFSAGAVALLVAALLILFIFRLAFGRRLHMPGGGRSRQPRLGIVDAFDLDRQRQLVLVRRDNVEHLVMIGGPNDVLIESQIVRVDARPREKETTGSPLTWTGAPAGEQKSLTHDLPVAARDEYPAQASGPSVNPPPLSTVPPLSSAPSLSSAPVVSTSSDATSAAPAPSIGSPTGSVPDVASPGISSPSHASPEVVPAPAPAAPAPPKRPSFLPPRRPLATPTFGPKPSAAAPGSAIPPVVTPNPSSETGNDGPLQESLAPAPVAPPPLSATPRPLSQPPSFLRPRPATTPLRPATPPPPPPPPVVEQQAPNVLPIDPPQPEPEKEKEPESAEKADTLDTLEEEMAKLLGRSIEKP